MSDNLYCACGKSWCALLYSGDEVDRARGAWQRTHSGNGHAPISAEEWRAGCEYYGLPTTQAAQTGGEQ